MNYSCTASVDKLTDTSPMEIRLQCQIYGILLLLCSCCCSICQIQPPHITYSSKLHWLPIQQRITHKIPSLTFKILHFNQSSYLYELLTAYNLTRSPRSYNQHLLLVPSVQSAHGRRSFFFAAPTIWNSLLLLFGLLRHLFYFILVSKHIFFHLSLFCLLGRIYWIFDPVPCLTPSYGSCVRTVWVEQ
jgi:hypothetical protein